MDLSKLKVPGNCGYFAMKREFPHDDKESMCFEIEPGEWCPLGHLEEHEYVYCCAVAALYWRKLAEDNERTRKRFSEYDHDLMNEPHRSDWSRMCALATLAQKQADLWQEAAFWEGER